MRFSVTEVYLRRFSAERALSLSPAILSSANRRSHLLTRASRVPIFKAISLPLNPLEAKRESEQRFCGRDRSLASEVCFRPSCKKGAAEATKRPRPVNCCDVRHRKSYRCHGRSGRGSTRALLHPEAES